ncbi:MAG: peptidoglycan-binding domain-containing protein [Chthoniobacteraceae bacterium]
MNRITTLGMALALAASLTAPAEAKSKKQKAAAQRVVASPAYQRALLAQRNPQAYREAVQRTPAYQRALLAQRNPQAYREAVQRTPQYQNALTYNKAVQRTPAYQRALLAQRDPQAYREAVQRTPQYQAALAAQRYGSSYYGGTYHQPPYSTCRDWDTDRVHYWNDRPWHWSGGSWVVRQGYAPAYSASVVIDRGGSSRSLVADVQAALADAGYDPGPVDGVPGSMTRHAVAAYQADNGLAATGRIDTSLVRSLGL